MLDSLPIELLQAVLIYVSNKSHLRALSGVSRKFRSLLFHRLFEVLTIQPHVEIYPWDLEWYPYFARDYIARVPQVLTAVKELHFRAPFKLTDLVQLRDGKSCEHSFPRGLYTSSRSSLGSEDDLPISWDDNDAVSRKQEDGEYSKELFESEHGDYGLMKLATKMARLLSALPDNRLTGFRWDMGTCFPNTILGEKGYLVTHQNCIRKLALVTEFGCVSGGPPLKEFTNLQELSWKGLLSNDDCASLKAFLELHHERLTSLEVDFINWAEVEYYFALPDDENDNEDDSTPLRDLILPERKDDYEDFMPNLQIFSLSAASFKGSWDHLIDAFNIHSVQELRLVNCKQTIELLDYMARTDVYPNATRVELVLRQAEMYEVEFDFIDFLASLHSLEDLFLMFQSNHADKYYFQMILRHRDTLRRLVFHRRHYCMAEKAPYWAQFCDSSLDETEGGGFADVLRQTMLHCVGVCGEPSKLQEKFQSIASTVNSLKLLHLRFTGKAERKPKFFKESEAHGGMPGYAQAYFEAQRNDRTPPQGRSEAEWQAIGEQIQGENWREDEEKELEAFANWAFGPDGFPRLQVLASGDFSYSNRFADTQTLWCRNTQDSRSNKAWRTVAQSDIAENELIDANMNMMSACPVSPLFYKYGRGDVFPGIS